MIGGSHPPAARSLTEPLFRFFGSTGVKMFLILTLALLPLGIIALVASLQAIQTADLEKEALLRVAVTQSARKLTADLESDRTALQLTVNNLAASPSDTSICDRFSLFLASNDRDGGRYFIYDRAGRKLCASPEGEPAILPREARFDGPAAQLLDLVELGTLRFHLLGDGPYKVVDAFLIPLRVEDDQTLVFPAHDSSLLLVVP